jgi:hypothetical protein
MRVVSLAFFAAVLTSCAKTTPPARAFQVKSRTELIGGKRALAEVGDFKLSNGIIHAIIQDVGTSRGFGSFGGSLIDVDLVRGTQGTPAEAPRGNDYFTEMFPAFFLTAIEPSKVEVLADGSDGAAAIVRVSGSSGNFLSLIKALTDVVDPKQKLDYTCDYILEPGKQYLKIVTTVSNPTTTDAAWGLSVPFGFVTLLGEGQRLFVPGQAGFDMRYHLEDTVYKRPASLNALPGEVTQLWATEGDGVSYALAIGRNPEGTYLDGKPEYPTAKPDSMLIPVASSSFLGSFWAKAPATLPPKASFSYTAYLAVGSGDVASVQQIIYDVRDSIQRPNGKEYVLRDKTPYGWLSGTVRETPTGIPLGGVSVVIQDEGGFYVSQATTNADGTWRAPVQPGKFRAYAVDPIRTVARSEELVAVGEGESARIDLRLEQPGYLQVVVRDEAGRALPAKISVEGVTENDDGTRPPRRFLYDLKVGERVRPSDLRRDEPGNADTQRYLERVFFAPHGAAGQALKAGTYTVYASRGIEYDLPSQTVTIEAGKTTDVGFTLKHVLKTPGWISGDFHVHSVKSVDSDMALTERVISYAAEGVDFLSSTDHNYVADYRPAIDGLKLNDWVRAVVGLELTSLEMGHFNAFPLLVQPGPVQHGSFRWFFRPPGELFAQLRGLGVDPQKTIVQVNHPRDPILGYFNAFNFGTFEGAPIPPTSSIHLDTSPQPDGTPSPYHPSNFSLDFDALEVFNGKRFDIMFNYRIPERVPEGPEPKIPFCGPGEPTTTECIPPPGEVLLELSKLEVPGQPTKYFKQPAYPGALDDWFTLLKQGRHITATGNSDSHGAKAEAGLPRTYIHVGASADSSMRGLDEAAVFDALRAGDAYPTNGPIIEVFEVNGQGMGRTVVAGDGVVDVKIVIKAAPWIDVQRVVVRRGGKDQGDSPEVLDVIPAKQTTEPERLNVTKRYTDLPDGSFLVIEVSGDRDMWPVHTPYEFPSLEISDAVGVIGGSFGFGDKHGKYKPRKAQRVTPYAFSNPIWVDRTLKQALLPAKRRLPVSNDQPFTPRSIPDLRKLFHAFHSDPE